MPEGDTIHRLAARINQRLAGERVERTITRDPRLVGISFDGAELLGAAAVGKHLFVRFGDGRSLHAHLRMDGSFVVGPPARGEAYHKRIELRFASGLMLTGIDVPVLAVIPTADEDGVVDHLGPDLCAPVPPSPEVVAARLRSEPAAPLAGALLDQRNVAGLGNVFANELPFLAGVSPNQPVGAIDDLELLAAAATALIRWSTANGVRNTTGRRLQRSSHWIYGLAGGRCPVCSTRLDEWREDDSPWRRSCVWCPECQPLTERRAVDGARIRRLLALHPAARSLPRS